MIHVISKISAHRGKSMVELNSPRMRNVQCSKSEWNRFMSLKQVKQQFHSTSLGRCTYINVMGPQRKADLGRLEIRLE